MQALPSLKVCRLNWIVNRAHKINVSNAPRWADCVMGGMRSFRCRSTTALLRCPKEMLIFLLWEIQLPLLWKCKAGFCGQVCSRDLSPSYKDKWGQFSFCLLLDKRCYFLVPILKTQRNNFLFRILFIKHQEIKILLLSKYRTVVFFPQTPNKVYWRQYKSKVGPINKPRPSRIWNFTA